MGWNLQNNGAKSVSPNFFENSSVPLEQREVQLSKIPYLKGNLFEINNCLGIKSTFN